MSLELKFSEEIGVRYMRRWEEDVILRQKGKIEALICFLEELGDISPKLKERINEEMSMSVIDRWLKLAAKSESISEFEQNM